MCQKEPDARSAPARESGDEETDTEKSDKGADIQRDVPAEDRSSRRATEIHDTAGRASDRTDGRHIREGKATKTRTREVAQRAYHNPPSPCSIAPHLTYHTQLLRSATSPARRTAICRSERPILQSQTLGPGSGSRSRLACLQGMNFTHTHTHTRILTNKL